MISETARQSRIGRIANLCALLGIGTGLLGLEGWLSGSQLLAGEVASAAPVITPLAALTIVLVGTGLWLNLRAEGQAHRRGPWGLALACNTLALLLAGQAVAFWLGGWDNALPSRIYLLFAGQGAMTQAAQIPLLSAVCLGALALAQLVLRFHRGYRLISILCIPAFLGGLWAIIEIGVHFQYASGMSLNTAAACLLLGFGTLLARPARWLTETVFSTGPVGRLARLLPFVILVPLVLSVVLVELSITGRLHERVQDELMVMLFTVSVGAMYWIILRYLMTSEMRMATARRLREREDQYQLIVESSHDGIVLTDAAGKFTYANHRLAEMLGRAYDELPGLDSAAFLKEEDLHRLPEMKARQRHGITEETELNLLRKDGSLLPVMVSSQPVTAADGTFTGSLSIVTDLSRIKSQEAERMKLQAQLAQAQKMEAVGTLAGGIAHDFNNILTAIIGYSDLAATSLHDPPAARECLQEVQQAADRAAELVKQILAFSRGKEPVRRPIRPSLIIAETRHLLRAALPTTIKITVNDLAQQATVLMDHNQLQQIVMNLGTNAAEAMGEAGGRLVISLREEEIEAWAVPGKHDLRSGPYVVLSVEDTGPGIPPEISERIFEPFFTTKGVGEGSGLGLSVVHGIVHEAGGAVSVYSEPGAGSTFNVYLPRLAKGDAPQTVVSSSPTPAQGKVFFIDDEGMLARMGSLALSQLGYEVETFVDPLQALATFGANPAACDIVISDQTMPGMTGLQLAQHLHALRPALPVIVCSGFSRDLADDGPRAPDIARFVPKPYSGRSLHEAIQEVLARGATEHPAAVA